MRALKLGLLANTCVSIDRFRLHPRLPWDDRDSSIEVFLLVTLPWMMLPMASLVPGIQRGLCPRTRTIWVRLETWQIVPIRLGRMTMEWLSSTTGRMVPEVRFWRSRRVLLPPGQDGDGSTRLTDLVRARFFFGAPETGRGSIADGSGAGGGGARGS